MTSEQTFVLATVIFVVFAIAIILASSYRRGIKRVILGRFSISPESGQRKPREPEQSLAESEPRVLTAEESKAELERLRQLIEDRKRIARNSDISYHLWGFYQSLVRYTGPHSLDRFIEGDEWYDVKILQVSEQNGLKTLEFKLKGARYKFVDDEDKQGLRLNMKLFSLFLHNDSDRCLIEIPMKMKVEGMGRKYSISSDGPKAFLPGDWINDFINVKLKHQRLRNQETRAQRHQERLSEIKDLKDRFGILD